MSSDEDAAGSSPLRELQADIVEGKRAAIESGDGDALLSATLTALMCRLEFPEWLGDSLAAAIYRYTHHEAGTLDEAFGVRRPAGYRRPAARERRQLAHLIYFDVQDMARAGAVIDEELFEAVGQFYGISRASASRHYYAKLKERGDKIESLPQIARDGLRPHLRSLEGTVKWKSDFSDWAES